MKFIEITLKTNRIKEIKKFYEEVIGFELARETPNKISFQIGSSLLTFVSSNLSIPYHFAINIPSYQEEEALKWLKERVSILKDEEHEIQDFASWNAKALYFYDPDQNIVEFIARRNLNYSSEKKFSAHSCIEISEMGMATRNFNKHLSTLYNNLKLEKFSGDEKVFSAIGAETGLFIVVDTNKKDWFPTDQKARPADFKALINIRRKNIQLSFIDDVIQIEP